MPFTFNGTGTRYLGEREHDIGGTYITTKWVVVLMVPVLPLSSWRVYPMGDAQFHDHSPLVSGEGSETTQGFHATPVPLNWRQVANVYAVTLAILGAVAWAVHRAYPGVFG